MELNRHNNFECQVSPDNENKHGELRAKAHISVLGKQTIIAAHNTDVSATNGATFRLSANTLLTVKLAINLVSQKPLNVVAALSNCCWTQH